MIGFILLAFLFWSVMGSVFFCEDDYEDRNARTELQQTHFVIMCGFFVWVALLCIFLKKLYQSEQQKAKKQ